MPPSPASQNVSEHECTRPGIEHEAIDCPGVEYSPLAQFSKDLQPPALSAPHNSFTYFRQQSGPSHMHIPIAARAPTELPSHTRSNVAFLPTASSLAPPIIPTSPNSIPSSAQYLSVGTSGTNTRKRGRHAESLPLAKCAKSKEAEACPRVVDEDIAH